MQEKSASIAEADQRSIAAFLERVWSEDGLADRTLEAYRQDLEGLARWLASRGRGLQNARREDLSAFHGSQAAAVRAMARRQSAFRRYDGQLARDTPAVGYPYALVRRP